jgi:hypothetical protein
VRAGVVVLLAVVSSDSSTVDKVDTVMFDGAGTSFFLGDPSEV